MEIEEVSQRSRAKRSAWSTLRGWFFWGSVQPPKKGGKWKCWHVLWFLGESRSPLKCGGEKEILKNLERATAVACTEIIWSTIGRLKIIHFGLSCVAGYSPSEEGNLPDDKGRPLRDVYNHTGAQCSRLGGFRSTCLTNMLIEKYVF